MEILYWFLGKKRCPRCESRNTCIHNGWLDQHECWNCGNIWDNEKYKTQQRKQRLHQLEQAYLQQQKELKQ